MSAIISEPMVRKNQPTTPAPGGWPILSLGLSRLEDWREESSYRLLPTDGAEFESFLSAVVPAQEIGNQNQIKAILLRLANAMALENRSDAEFAMFLRDFVDDLSDLPIAAVERAAVIWRRTNRFFPKIADLRGLALAETKRIARLAYKAAFALEFNATSWTYDERFEAHRRATKALTARGIKTIWPEV